MTTSRLNLFNHTAAQARTWLADAVAQGEGAQLEFKSSFQKEVIKTLPALANTSSGVTIATLSIGEHPVKPVACKGRHLYGLPEPVFEATQGGVAVTVFNTARSEPAKTPRIRVNEGAHALLQAIVGQP